MTNVTAWTDGRYYYGNTVQKYASRENSTICLLILSYDSPLNPLETGVLMTKSIQSSLHGLHSAFSNETFSSNS